MTLRFLDISNYQAGIKLANTDAQAVICKATEGTSFVDKYCDGFISQAKNLRLPYGVYHFFRGSGVAEAKFFLDNVGGYIGKGVLVLDWENGAGAAGEAKKFLDYVKQETGVTPWVYTVKSYLSSAKAIEAAGYPLWIAYPSSADSYGSVSPWKSALAWQYSWEHRTGGYTVDADRFYGDKADWAAHASGKGSASGGDSTQHEDQPPTKGSIQTPYGQKGSSWASGYHQGDDWHRNAGQAEVGDPIWAVASGTIIYAGDARQTDAGWGSAFGIHVLIEWDEHGRTSIDAHMSKLHVKTGDRVKVGDLIGEKGATGNVSGPHDHHEQHTGTRWTDPDVKPIYPGKEGSAPATTDDEEFAVSEQTTMKRTKAQGIHPDGEYHELRLEDSGDLSFGFGGGAYQIDARFVLTGLSAAEELLVRVIRFDTDASKDSARIEGSDTVYWVQGLPGGGGKSYRNFAWKWHVPSPPKGHGRRLRIEAANFTDHDIMVESINTAIWKAKLS